MGILRTLDPTSRDADDMRRLGVSSSYVPHRARVIAFGTSSIQNHSFVNPNSVIAASAVGMFNALRKLFPGVDFYNWVDVVDARGFHGSNFGFQGVLNSVLLPHIPDIIAASPAHVHLQFSQNDINGSGSVEAAVDDVRSAVSQFRAAGISVSVETLNPRGQTGVNAKATTDKAYFWRQNEYNRRIVALAEELSIPCVDTRAALYDFATSPLGIAKANVSKDGLHLTPYGTMLKAQAFEPVFRRIFKSLRLWVHSLIATAANYFSNGALAGTGGVHGGFTRLDGGAAASGVLPDKVRMGLASSNSTSNSFGVNSVILDPDAGWAIRTEYTLVSADITNKWRYLFTDTASVGFSGFAASGIVSKWFRPFVSLYIEAGAELIQDAMVTAYARDGTGAGAAICGGSIDFISEAITTEPIGDASLNGRTLEFLGDPFQATAGAAAFLLMLELQLGGTGAVNVHVGKPAILEVADPRF